MSRIERSAAYQQEQVITPIAAFDTEARSSQKAKTTVRTHKDRATALRRDYPPPIDMGPVHHQLGILLSLAPPEALQPDDIGYYVAPNGRTWTNRKCYELGDNLLQFDGRLAALNAPGFLSLVFDPGPDGQPEVFVRSPGHPYTKLSRSPQPVFDAALRALVDVNERAARGEWRAGIPIPNPLAYANRLARERR
jgi:hypothetical protein